MYAHFKNKCSEVESLGCDRYIFVFLGDHQGIFQTGHAFYNPVECKHSYPLTSLNKHFLYFTDSHVIMGYSTVCLLYKQESISLNLYKIY